MTEDFEVPADEEAVPVFVDYLQLDDDLQQVEAVVGSIDRAAKLSSEVEDRLLADQLLLRRLFAAGLQGPEYDAFIVELTRYGLAVMTAWALDGSAFVRAFKVGRPVAVEHRPLAGRTHRDDALAIADLTVTLGLQLFDKVVLRERTWCPDRGASIKTYFIGGCLLKLSNACRMWRADTPMCEIPTGEALHVPGPRQQSDPQNIAVLREMIMQVLGSEPPRIAKMLALAAEGYTHREIAEALGGGISERGVEGELYRARRRARLVLKGGDSDADHARLR
ncbi:helix-turn-helix domain-containing protein [Catellatospora vulcania]|uniref:sigma factor-like helix-turn-helix DNA-binding protein n=1 Tax=Catellatospora vulcania TaxID=1460450 RepID=UPI0012D454D6|nr:sigma factor-like helix-turn-helix DNA-binding protein [Catellatospora vulcania]